MKKNDIFSFKAPNGAEVTAVALYEIDSNITEDGYCYTWLCYAQNRLITIYETLYYIDTPLNPPINGIAWRREESTYIKYGKIIVDYCIIPSCDELLARYNDIEVSRAETANGM